MRKTTTPLRILGGLLGLCALADTHAGELYASAGVPGLMLGYSLSVNDQFSLRADMSTLGRPSRVRNEQGIRYDSALKAQRLGLFGDWYPINDSGFRLVGGLTLNDYALDLDAAGAGRTIKVGAGQYTLTAADGLGVRVKFADTTPYLGLGWGHRTGDGWRFAFDLGAMIGRAQVSVLPRGQLATPAAQADVDRELAELRNGVGKVNALPQLSVSLGYAF